MITTVGLFADVDAHIRAVMLVVILGAIGGAVWLSQQGRARQS